MAEQSVINLRGYIKRDGDQWVAVCLELSLAAQADSFESVKENMRNMISDYLTEAVNEDQEFMEQLLDRPAPINQWMTYYYYRFLAWKQKDAKPDRKGFDFFDREFPVATA